MRTWSTSHLIHCCYLALLLFYPQISHSNELGPTRCLNQKSVDKTTVSTTSSSAEIPTPLKKPKVIIPLGCNRPFTIQGEPYSADSPQAQDASNLKFFTKDVPEATSILDEYQSNRNKSKLSAYTGTAGILLIFLANTISNQFEAANRDSIRSAVQVSGIALAAGGFFYSFTLLRVNESLIPKSVNTYNEAKPNNPIELQFNTGWSF